MGIESKVFMFTGRIRVPRYEAQDLVESLGGIAGSSVTHSTDYLVVGEDPGSKLGKAQAYGIKVLSEDEFWSLIESCKATEGLKVQLSPEQQDNPSLITNEQWTQISNLPVKIVTASQLERLLKAYSPSYENPKKLEEIKKSYPDLQMLGPKVCSFCGKEIPYSIRQDYYCFYCKQYSSAETHYHIWTNPMIPGTITSKGTHCMCLLCDEFLFLTHREYEEFLTSYQDRDYFNSVEYLVEGIEKERELENLVVEIPHTCSDWEILDIATERGFYGKCKDCGKLVFVESDELVSLIERHQKLQPR